MSDKKHSEQIESYFWDEYSKAELSSFSELIDNEPEDERNSTNQCLACEAIFHCRDDEKNDAMVCNNECLTNYHVN